MRTRTPAATSSVTRAMSRVTGNTASLVRASSRMSFIAKTGGFDSSHSAVHGSSTPSSAIVANHSIWFATMKWKIGDVTVTKVTEIEFTQSLTWIVPDLTADNLARPELAWCRPHFAQDDGKVHLSVHALVVESQGQRIIVDTCVGNDKHIRVSSWNQRQGPFLDDLAAAGFTPDGIDTVLCTHLHVDHVGWNTRLDNGKWVPTFENARYLWHRAEYEH